MSATTVKARVQSAAAGGYISVLRAGKTVAESVSVDRDIAAAAVAGDWVLMLVGEGVPFVVALLGTTTGSAPPALPTIPTEPTPDEWQTFTPTWSGTYRDGRWRSDMSDMVQGSGGTYGISQGAAFYGTGPRTSTWASGSVRLERLAFGTYGSGAPTMRLLAGSAPGTAYPTVLATAAGPSLPSVGSVADWAIPTGWLADLTSGVAGGIGIGVAGSTPYMKLSGPRAALTLRRA